MDGLLSLSLRASIPTGRYVSPVEIGCAMRRAEREDREAESRWGHAPDDLKSAPRDMSTRISGSCADQGDTSRMSRRRVSKFSDRSGMD